MNIRGTSVLLLAATVAIGAVQVKHLNAAEAPANVPPASYSGTQFVDNAGCVYVRAGLGGQVSWVPRVSRERKPVCGMAPTFGAASDTTKVEVPQARSEPRVAQTVTATSAPVVKAAPTTRTTTRKTATKKRYPAPKAKAQLSGFPLPEGRKYVLVTPATAKNTLNGSEGLPRRSLKSLPNVPKGYKYAFGSGRANPNRGLLASGGVVPSHLGWTNENPPRLVDYNTGKVVTDKYPEVKYIGPGASARVSSKSVADKAGRTARLSTKTGPAPRKGDAVGSHRYVQVGSYGTPANAKRAAARLKAQGLPVRTAKGKIGGKTVKVVLAGPFTSGAQTQRALTTARSAGFHDAFPRK